MRRAGGQDGRPAFRFAILASLLTAQASGTPIVFHEGACSSTWKGCEVTELLIGSGGAF